MIKVGDLVIRCTGGNKMKVTSIRNDVAECVWLTEKFNSAYFNIKDLREFSEYKTLFIDEKREEKLKIILGNT